MMTKNFLTIYETLSFTKKIRKLLKQEERLELIEHLSKYPEKGNVISGTDGLRKMRWGSHARGKRGGIRIIYYYHVVGYEIFLLTLYTKNNKEDLTTYDKKILKGLVKEYLK